MTLGEFTPWCAVEIQFEVFCVGLALEGAMPAEFPRAQLRGME
jgi:hypothetical protein